MSHIRRKPVFVVSNQVRHKLGCTAKEDGQRLEMAVLEKVEELYHLCSENKGVDQLHGTLQLTCIFVFYICKNQVFS